MGDAKRSQLASSAQTLKQHAPVSEVGVCVGTNPIFPGTYLFYIDSTRQIVPRRVVKVLRDVIPFGWPTKKSMFRTLQQFPVNFEDPVLPNTHVQPSSTQSTLPLSAPVVHDELTFSPPTAAQQFVHDLPVQPRAPPDFVAVPHVPPIPVPVVTQHLPVPVLVPNNPVPAVHAPDEPVFSTSSVAPRRSTRSTSGRPAPLLTYSSPGIPDPSSYVAAPVYNVGDNFIMPHIHGSARLPNLLPVAPAAHQRSRRRSAAPPMPASRLPL